MSLLLNTLTVAVLLLLCGLAFWSWRRYRITVFFWFIAARILQSVAAMLSAPLPDPDGLFERLQQRFDLEHVEVAKLLTTYNVLWPNIVNLFLVLILVAEIAHLGRRFTPAQEPPKLLRLAHRVRPVLGILAIAAAILPHRIFYLL